MHSSGDDAHPRASRKACAYIETILWDSICQTERRKGREFKPRKLPEDCDIVFAEVPALVHFMRGFIVTLICDATRSATSLENGLQEKGNRSGKM